MANKGAQNIGLGVFIIAGIGLLIGFIYYIGANQNLFGSTTQVSTIFHNISGLQVGANARFAGINVGTIEGITIISDTTVRVDVRLENKVIPYVKKDSRMSIGSDGLMGDKVLAIGSGAVGAESVKGGDVLPSEEPLELDAIMAKAATMASSVSEITSNVANITTTIKQGRGTIGMLLYDQKAADRMRFLLTGLNRTVGSLNKNLQNAEQGTEAFSENMKALQGNFLLKGYFKKKEKEKEKVRLDSVDKATESEKRRVNDAIQNQRKLDKDKKKQARADHKIEKTLAKARKDSAAKQMSQK